MWRFISVLALTLAIAYGSTQSNFDLTRKVQSRLFEDQVHAMLKNLSDQLAQQDPYFIAKVQYDIEGEVGNLHFSAEDISITGYSNFSATNLKIGVFPPSMTFDIGFDNIHVLVPRYSIDLLAVFVPFYGHGFINLETSTLSLGGQAKLAFGTGGIQGISNTEVRFNLTESNLTISGILDHIALSDIVSTATTECFPEFIRMHGKHIGGLAGKFLESAINRLLNPPASSVPKVTRGSDTFKMGDLNVKYSYEL